MSAQIFPNMSVAVSVISASWHVMCPRRWFVQVDFKGAMKLVNTAEEGQLNTEERLKELEVENQRLQQEKQAAMTAVRNADN